MDVDSINSSENEHHVVSEWVTFFTEIERFVASASRQIGFANEQFSEFVVDRLEIFIVSVSSLLSHLGANLPSNERSMENAISRICSNLTVLLGCLRAILSEWEDYLNHHCCTGGNMYSYTAPVAVSSLPGRPRFDISKEQLEYLHSMSFTWVQIADLLGVSRMTIYRRRREFGLTEIASTNITDRELEHTLHQMRRDFPSIGQTMVWATLRSMGYRVTRERVREAIRITDPINTSLRWREVSVRRTYSVPGPNSLWHLGMVMNVSLV